MTGDRARGVALYTGAAALLTAGTLWWFAAAPREPRNRQIDEWRATALRLLPDNAGQQHADTMPLPAGAEHEALAEVAPGEYLVTLVCVGGPGSLVRVSLGEDGTDSGQGLRCSGDIVPENFSVSVAGELRLNVTVGASGPVVFRYSLLRTQG